MNINTKLILFLLILSSPGFLFSKERGVESKLIEACHNYENKPQPIHKNHHFYDGDIHFAPIFKMGGKYQNGYVIKFLKPKSIYEKLKLKVGDIVTHVDGVPVNKKISISSKYLSNIKTNKFSKLKIERCNKMEIKKLN